MKRRTLLASLAAASAGYGAHPASALTPDGVPAAGKLVFDVIRKGSRIGSQVMQFGSSGDVLTVRTEVEMRVALGPLTLFSYRHHAVERWQDGRFAALDTRTDNDGTALWVQAASDPSGVRIKAAHGGTVQPPLLLPAGTLPLTHWNRAVTRAPLFDPQDGVAVPERVTPRGPGTVALANGRPVAAERFDFAGKANLSDWYDTQSVWTALSAVVSDGSVVEYRRTV